MKKYLKQYGVRMAVIIVAAALLIGLASRPKADGSSGAVEIKANKEIKLSAAQINAKASGTAELSANSSVTVKSSGVTTIKGSMTKIN